MTRRWSTAALLFCLSAGLLGCRSIEEQPSAKRPVDEPIQVPRTVRETMGLELVSVRTAAIGERTVAPATLTLDENRTARIGALIEGRAIAVLADVGDRVRPGQPLAYLSSPAWQQARADVRKARAKELIARQEFAYASQVLARARRLLAAHAISRQEVEKAELDRIVARQRLVAARAERTRAQQSLRQLVAFGPTIQEDDEWLAVASPIAGSVIERNIAVASSVSPGTPLFVVSDLSSLWLLAEVPETELRKLQAQDRAEFRVAAYPGERFSARIERVSDTLDPDTRRLRVRLSVNNGDYRLKPNMFASLELSPLEPQEALVVPEVALQDLEGHTVVFVAESEDSFRPRPVQVGRTENGLAEILTGLRLGETVVGTGSHLLKSAMVLRAHPEEE